MISNFRRVLNLVCILWVFPRRPIVVCRRFGTLYQFHQFQPLKMGLIEGSETSVNHNRTPGKYPKEYIQETSSNLKNAWSPNFTPPYISMPIRGRIVPLPFTVAPYLLYALVSQLFLIHSHGQFSFFFVTCKAIIQGVPGGICQTSGECSLCSSIPI